MTSPLIVSRTPFRLPLGGGSTDMLSYYSKFGGFIFAVTVDLYMDVLIKATRSDDLINVHYKMFEGVKKVSRVEHPFAREALKVVGLSHGVSISFKADAPAGTGLGSSGACSVALLKGLSRYVGKEMSRREAAEHAFAITQRLGLPDGVQDPYVCALGGFVALRIAKNGTVTVERPRLSPQTVRRLFENSLFYFTGVKRESTGILRAQNVANVLTLKHRIREIGKEIYRAFLKDDLNRFGTLMDEHWEIKKKMSPRISSTFFDNVYVAAKRAGALGGKIMGAGGGGYFMFYCPTRQEKEAVRKALMRFKMREMDLKLDTKGSRTLAFNP